MNREQGQQVEDNRADAAPAPTEVCDGSGASAAAASETWSVQVHAGPSEIDAQAWNDLLDACPQPTPFMRHEWLQALHDTGCAAESTGWAPLFLTVATPAGGELAAACPLYLKTHSYGEYVFDWAWADAYQRQGLHYYPKLLSASPFTPVPGSRLLARNDAARAALLKGMEQLAHQADWSSAHVLFLDDADRAVAEQQGWMLRRTVQFHWHNRHPETGLPFGDFADMLATMQREKRKKIQQERRRVGEAGVTVQAWEAAAITSEHWDYFYNCYARTYRAHGQRPYLTRKFFERVAQTLPQHWLLFIAERAGQWVAASLSGLDRARGAAFGRYWGATEDIPFLHFELCYYAPLQWCIANGIQRFEGGAQGEHKMARGLLPVQTWSAHWLSHQGFAEAVARHLEREGSGVSAYVDELHEHNPFKSGPPA